jgi:gluconolactonase
MSLSRFSPRPSLRIRHVPLGKLLNFIPIQEDFITNNALGGSDRKTLYVTAGKTLYRIRTEIAGLPR